MSATELIVPLDGSPLADKAIAHAAEIARRTDGTLHLVRVHTPVSALVAPIDSAVSFAEPFFDARLRGDSERWIAKKAASVGDLNDVPVSFELRIGVPEAEIVLAAAERRSKAIVCTTHGWGGGDSDWMGSRTRTMGSVAGVITRRARCPVLAMSPAAVRRDVHARSLLVLLDGSAASASIMPHAQWLGRALGADLDFLRILQPTPDAASAIAEYIERANPDAIALATHGRGLTRLFLGGVADEVIRQCGRPTLVFRPHDLDWAPRTNDRALLARIMQ